MPRPPRRRSFSAGLAALDLEVDVAVRRRPRVLLELVVFRDAAVRRALEGGG